MNASFLIPHPWLLINPPSSICFFLSFRALHYSKPHLSFLSFHFFKNPKLLFSYFSNALSVPMNKWKKKPRKRFENACEGNAPLVLHLAGKSGDRERLSGARGCCVVQDEESPGWWIWRHCAAGIRGHGGRSSLQVDQLRQGMEIPLVSPPQWRALLYKDLLAGKSQPPLSGWRCAPHRRSHRQPPCQRCRHRAPEESQTSFLFFLCRRASQGIWLFNFHY